MKNLRFLSLIFLVIFITAWAPMPSILQATIPAPILVAPASGALVTGYQPTFQWKPLAVTPDSYTLQLSFDPYMKNVAKEIDTVTGISPTPVAGLVSYTPATDIPSNAKVYWRVWGVKGADTPTKSSIRYVKTYPLPVADITSPTEAERVNSLRPTIEWEPVDRVLSYDVWLLQNSVVKAKYITTTSSYTFIKDLLRNTDYQVEVRSKSIHGSTVNSAWTSLRAFTTPNPPGVPVLLAPANGFTLPTGMFTPTFDWTDVTSPENPPLPVTYSLQLSTNSKFSVIYRQVDDIPASTHTLVASLDTGTYYWRVRSEDSGGAVSNWSVYRIVKTQPALNVLVRDYLTKDPIEGVTVTITGLTGPFVTDADGYVKLAEIKPGSKSISASKDDYVKKSTSTTIVAGTIKTVTIEMVHIPMKVVLTWKTTQNLDLHLWLPIDFNQAGDKGHISWANRGSTTRYPYAALSTTDSNGYGPETLVIQNRYPGTYIMGVFNYTKNGKFIDSGATIKIYKGTQLVPGVIDTSNAPDNSFLWWQIPSINGTTGVIDPINQLWTLQDFPAPYDKDGGTFAVPEQ